jgi:hypothetical protein
VTTSNALHILTPNCLISGTAIDRFAKNRTAHRQTGDGERDDNKNFSQLQNIQHFLTSHKNARIYAKNAADRGEIAR